MKKLSIVVLFLAAEFSVISQEIKRTMSGNFSGQNIVLMPDSEHVVSVDASKEKKGQLAVINLQNPKEIRYVSGSYGMPGLAPTPIAVTPNSKNVIVADKKENNLIIIDISNPNKPKKISEIKGGYWWQPIVVTSDSKYLMTVDSSTQNIMLDPLEGKIKVFDISDPKNPK